MSSLSERRIHVLRYGHRPGRDKRVTTHVLLVARAFGANGFVLGDVVDESIEKAYRKVVSTWGGDLYFEMGVNSERYCLEWKQSGGMIVHLTMYGLHIDDVIDKIRQDRRDLLIVVGAKKVPRFFYEVADYNVAIGHQPHSEVAALAVFLDRLFQGRELYLKFSNAKIEVVPSPRGKRIVRLS
ncbi:MAG: tRNA (cytidine(56)-2'-O)-methyltransferase [Desulfurococcaceae archaeon]